MKGLIEASTLESSVSEHPVVQKKRGGGCIRDMTSRQADLKKLCTILCACLPPAGWSPSTVKHLNEKTA